tara:strand:+ start:203 stop:346 length:144 start_codon:yes stop_codon:yes gene_type:complete
MKFKMNLKKKILILLTLSLLYFTYSKIIEAGGLSISLNTPISFPVDI